MQGQRCRQCFERARAIFPGTCQWVDLTLGRREHGVLPWSGEVCDWRRCTHQNKLAKFLQLLDSLLQNVVNPFDRGFARATFQPGERIGRQQLGVGGSSDAPGHL